MRPALLDRLFPTSTPFLRKLWGAPGELPEQAASQQCFQFPVFDQNRYPNFCLTCECKGWKWDKAPWGWRRLLQWLLFRRRGHCHHGALR